MRGCYQLVACYVCDTIVSTSHAEQIWSFVFIILWKSALRLILVEPFLDVILNNNFYFNNTRWYYFVNYSTKGNALFIVEKWGTLLFARIVGKIKSNHKIKAICSNAWNSSLLNKLFIEWPGILSITRGICRILDLLIEILQINVQLNDRMM